MNPRASPAESSVSRRAVTALVTTAVVAIALGAYQWWALIELHTSGEAPLCGAGEHLDCARVWDSELAQAVHRYTGLPFAAWGVAWGTVLLVMSLLLAWRGSTGHIKHLALGLKLTTGAGALVALGLAVYSLRLGVFCPTCLLFYGLVAAGLYTSLRYLPPAGGDWRRALGSSATTLAVVVAILLYPGIQTPHQSAAVATIAEPPESSAPQAPQTSQAANAALARFIDGLPPPVQQRLSNTLASYRQASPVSQPLAADRLLHGDPKASVHLVEWIDIRCPHCKNLATALGSIREATPRQAFNEEMRHYPLDSRCNPHLRRSHGGVSCLAAKVLICLAESPRAPGVREQLFTEQRNLSRDRVWDIAARNREERQTLARCVDNPATEATLQRDIEQATEHGIEGTPFILINGKPAANFPPLIYALILTGGDVSAPAFDRLPLSRAGRAQR